MRIALRLEYEGTDYAGWQIQDNAPSIQGWLENAVQAVCGRPTRVTGAGRTDAGVHALGQVAHFDTQAALPPDRWAYALNAHLPRDVRVQASCAVPESFHARFDACGKHYRYVLHLAPQPPAILWRHAWHLRDHLDVTAMQEAGMLFCGRRDYAAFMSAGSSVQDTVRQVQEATVQRQGPWVTVDVKGSGFLYNMVRILVGTLVEMGRGERPPQDMLAILAGRERALAGVTAPAQGLHLMQVFYPNPPFCEKSPENPPKHG